MKNSRYISALIVKFAILMALGLAAKLYADPLLNGVATHSELGKEQFIAGLFTSTLSTSSNSILSTQEKKRLQVRVLAPHLSSRRFRRMWIEGMAINSSPAELEKYARDMANFSNMMKIKMIAGDIFTIDRAEDSVQISINGILLGEVDDPQFFDLILRTWIGPVPLSSEFRNDLLTAGSIKPGPLTRFETTKPSDERIAAIDSAISIKLAGRSTSKKKPPTPDKPSVRAPVNAVPLIKAPAVVKITLEAPTIVEATPKPKPTAAPVVIASIVQADELDDSIFDDDDADDLTAESLLKEQLYYSQLAKYTHKYLQYPSRAWDRGREGNIRLKVTIDRKGKVKETVILDSARFKSLNKEAKKAVSRASPYPIMPDDLKGDDYSFTFRIAFKITK